MTRRPPTSTLFPYTTLFRKSPREDDRARNNAPQSWVARASRVLVLASRQNELSRCRHAAPEKARFLQSRQQIHSHIFPNGRPDRSQASSLSRSPERESQSCSLR